MICETVKDLVDSINHCCYVRENVLVCNLCGETKLTLIEMLVHLKENHINDIIPDVDPTK